MSWVTVSSASISTGLPCLPIAAPIRAESDPFTGAVWLYQYPRFALPLPSYTKPADQKVVYDTIGGRRGQQTEGFRAAVSIILGL
jgi:hypothetical protein